MPVNAAIVGMEPIHGDIRMGQDGQLWRFWPKHGQETVASGGHEAVQYAIEQGFPESVVELIRAKGIQAKEQMTRRW